MIASVKAAASYAEKLALIDSIIDKHTAAIELLRDLKISLLIERSQEKNKEISNDT